ncbi:MAG TPA: mobile mystery protein A [Bacteroidetes bacterium]|nr:mobile mystery protein A [Bacteroidota bacterium]
MKKLKNTDFKLKQLDNKFDYLKEFKKVERPKEGWINEIRKSLGMTYKNLADKLKVSPPMIKLYEKSEINNKITIETLSKVAESMNCKFVYAIIPETSLQKIIYDRTDEVVDYIMDKSNRLMELENQNTNNEFKKQQKKDIIRNLENKNIWNYEI